MVKTPDSHSGDQWFDPTTPHHKTKGTIMYTIVYKDSSKPIQYKGMWINGLFFLFTEDELKQIRS